MGRKDKASSEDSIGAYLKQVREQANVSQTDMARHLGYSKEHLSRVENGAATPSDELIAAYKTQVGEVTGAIITSDESVSAWRPNSPSVVRFVFVAECIASHVSDQFTIFNTAAISEPFLREEFVAILQSFFAGEVKVVTSMILNDTPDD
jgi:transcriptional regulator with XRE-family HTH domain